MAEVAVPETHRQGPRPPAPAAVGLQEEVRPRLVRRYEMVIAVALEVTASGRSMR